MWSNFFQNHSNCFIDISLHILNCLNCNMFHNFLGIFHLPPIYQKWGVSKSDPIFFQYHSKCFIHISLYMIKCLNCKMYHHFLGMFHYMYMYICTSHAFTQKWGVWKCNLFFSKTTQNAVHNQVLQLQNVQWVSWNVPFTSHLPLNQGFQNAIQSSPKLHEMHWRHNQVLNIQNAP
jgi:hypothetical protein